MSPRAVPPPGWVVSSAQGESLLRESPVRLQGANEPWTWAHPHLQSPWARVPSGGDRLSGPVIRTVGCTVARQSPTGGKEFVKTPQRERERTQDVGSPCLGPIPRISEGGLGSGVVSPLLPCALAQTGREITAWMGHSQSRRGKVWGRRRCSHSTKTGQRGETQPGTGPHPLRLLQ